MEDAAPNWPAEASRPAVRLAGLDATRGLIILVMALDHTRMFFSGATFDPLDLQHGNAGWFLTRWITHLCAPGFFAIAGIGAALSEKPGAKSELARFLFARGWWLIAVEVVVLGISWSFNPGWFWFGVLASLGAGMILLSGAIFLPKWLLLALAGGFALLSTDLANWIQPGHSPLVALLYSGGLAQTPGLGPRIILFPILPWACLMVLGYAAGRFFVRRDGVKTERLLIAGAAMLAAFVVLRLAGYGEPAGSAHPPQADAVRSLLSFLNVAKYPPSAQFSLVTLGCMALVLAFLSRPNVAASAPARLLETYGRVPFFFYVLHIPLIHALAAATAATLGWPTGYLVWKDPWPNLGPPAGYGFGLGGVYLAWFAVLAILYWPCARFSALKRSRNDWWLRLL